MSLKLEVDNGKNLDFLTMEAAPMPAYDADMSVENKADAPPPVDPVDLIDPLIPPTDAYFPSGCATDKPSILLLAKSLGDKINTALQEMAAGQPHPDTISLRRKKALRTITYSRPKLDSILLGPGVVPLFALPALVIREALNMRRGLAAGDSRLRRLLQGSHATRSSATPHGGNRNLDHIDPCREFNRYTTLFQAHFSPAQLTGPLGLSNALAWFGTGQGAGTEQWLNSLIPDGGFFQPDVEGMIRQFRSAISQNAMNGNNLQYDNSRAWGQPNHHLLAQPTKYRPQDSKPKRTILTTNGRRKHKLAKKLTTQNQPKEYHTLEEKFDPMFAETVSVPWTGHLGVIAGRDPRKCNPDELPNWYPTVCLVESLGIPSFKQGLGAMQLVNTLAFCGVVQKPTVEEMAEWICQNADLGAVAGLKLMGFQVSTSDQIQGSYICFHNILERFLTQEDKDEVGFHPPFSEHVLCKTPRWNNYLVADQSDSLVQMAGQLEHVLWVSGANLRDPSAMPFPLFPTLQDLREALMNNEDLELDDHNLVGEQPEFIQGSSRTGRVIQESFTDGV
ncbi:hypothetical protein DFH08DRAFT_963644 [Mycena albidolilacea]|uniref:Uncharacterized protein n=1 Tax=Mycena albidolilacea TaxID=1033008 RepID=A0AAD6ZV42_9AGAR|nr:hypothetical protein DFH08DRAFT_963644 [Mycena albidolilacea]